MALNGLTASQADTPVIRPGSSFAMRFPRAGTYKFEDPQDPQNKMTVVVKAGATDPIYLLVVIGK